MAMDARRDPESSRGAIKRVADQLGVHPEALRNWVRQAQIDGGARPGTTTSDAERLAQLEREVRELRRANEIMKTSAAFFAGIPPGGHSLRGPMRQEALVMGPSREQTCHCAGVCVDTHGRTTYRAAHSC